MKKLHAKTPELPAHNVKPAEDNVDHFSIADVRRKTRSLPQQLIRILNYDDDLQRYEQL